MIETIGITSDRADCADRSDVVGGPNSGFGGKNFWKSPSSGFFNNIGTNKTLAPEG